MDRTLFYKKIWNEEGQVDELDFLWSNMSKFTMTYNPAYYRVISTDAMRPDIISYRMYGTTNYWWVICLVNAIDNPLEDLAIGILLQIPNKMDIYTFYRRFRVR